MDLFFRQLVQCIDRKLAYAILVRMDLKYASR